MRVATARFRPVPVPAELTSHQNVDPLPAALANFAQEVLFQDTLKGFLLA